MAYWFVEGSKNSRQVQFYMDTDADKESLPTTSKTGVKQDDDVTYLPVERGSSALSLASGKIFVLTSGDIWIEFGKGIPKPTTPIEDLDEVDDEF